MGADDGVIIVPTRRPPISLIAMIPHPTRAACSLLALFVSAAGAPLASAGPVLLERASDIRASGASASGEYQLSNGSADFAAFTDGLLSSDEAAARSAAQQHSSPTLDAAGALSGASAEGSARASVDFGVEDAFSNAETDFDLVFRVEGAPALFTFDATLAATGDASSGVVLHNKEDNEAPPVFAFDVAEESRTVTQTAVLAPGIYGLSIWSFARGTPDESAASYAMAVSLADGEPGVVPMPLPAAAWAGLIGLSVAGGLAYRARRKQTIALG